MRLEELKTKLAVQLDLHFFEQNHQQIKLLKVFNQG